MECNILDVALHNLEPSLYHNGIPTIPAPSGVNRLFDWEYPGRLEKEGGHPAMNHWDGFAGRPYRVERIPFLERGTLSGVPDP